MSEPYQDISEIVVSLKALIDKWDSSDDVLADSACRIASNMLKVLRIQYGPKR